MVAREPTERAVEARRVEGAQFAAGLRERTPEAGRELPRRAEPVPHDADPHVVARARLLDQEITKPGSELVLVEIVALDEDRARCASNRLAPSREVLCRVAE
jgi:hypothetical protein